MTQTPDETSTKTSPAPQSRPTRWMIVTGCILLGLAAVCLLTTVAMLLWSFGEHAGPNTTMEALDLASEVKTDMISSYAVIPLGLAGIAFLIFGFVRRQAVTNA